MAKTAVINIRTEAKTKRDVEQLFSQFGITTSDAVNMFFAQSLMEGGLPFQVRIPSYNKETQSAMDDVLNDRNMSRTYDSIDEMMKDLDA